MSLRLRRPRAAFGLLALALYLIIGLAACVAIIGLGGLYAAPHAQALMWPAIIATIILSAAIGPRLRRGQIAKRVDVISSAAVAGAIAGIVWPLSFAASIAVEDGAGPLIAALQPMAVGAGIGALAGAIAGAAAGLVAMSKR